MRVEEYMRWKFSEGSNAKGIKTKRGADAVGQEDPDRVCGYERRD